MFVGMPVLEGDLIATLLVVNTSDTPINADALPSYRVYGPNGFVVSGSCTLRDSGSVSGATNASPIVITSSNHGLTTGAYVTVAGVEGCTAANGNFKVTRVSANEFSLDGSSGNGPYTTGGTWNTAGLYRYAIDIAGSDGFDSGECYQVLFTYAISTTQKGQQHTFVVT